VLKRAEEGEGRKQTEERKKKALVCQAQSQSATTRMGYERGHTGTPEGRQEEGD